MPCLNKHRPALGTSGREYGGSCFVLSGGPSLCCNSRRWAWPSIPPPPNCAVGSGRGFMAREEKEGALGKVAMGQCAQAELLPAALEKVIQ